MKHIHLAHFFYICIIALFVASAFIFVPSGYAQTCEGGSVCYGDQTCEDGDLSVVSTCECEPDGSVGGGGTCESSDPISSGPTPRPDLIIKSMTNIPAGSVGTVATFKVTVENRDYTSSQYTPAPAEGGYQVAFNNNTAFMGCGSTKTGSSGTLDTLDVGETKTFRFSFTRPSTPGTYDITVLVDSTCFQKEYLETNNAYNTTYTVTALECNDGFDNDGDGATDYPADSGCISASDATEAGQCQDGIDNDGDGFIDLADFGCSGVSDDNEGDGTSQCQDGIDNDGDARIDYGDDPACTNSQDNNEGDDPERPGPLPKLMLVFSTPGDKTLSVSFDDGVGSSLGPNVCPLVTVTQGPISGQLSVAPLSGNSPFQIIATAEILSGYVDAFTTNYTFWWNCSDTTTSVSAATSACGDPNDSAIGVKLDGQNSDSLTVAHTYINSGQSPITAIPKVIIEHGSASSIQGNSQTVTINPALPDVTCTPSSFNATRGSSRTFNASGGSGNFSWTITPSANCSPTSGSGSSFNVSCTTNGIREIQVDDDDPNTAPDTCLLQVTQPGLIEI